MGRPSQPHTGRPPSLLLPQPGSLCASLAPHPHPRQARLLGLWAGGDPGAPTPGGPLGFRGGGVRALLFRESALPPETATCLPAGWVPAAAACPPAPRCARVPTTKCSCGWWASTGRRRSRPAPREQDTAGTGDTRAPTGRTARSPAASLEVTSARPPIVAQSSAFPRIGRPSSRVPRS